MVRMKQTILAALLVTGSFVGASAQWIQVGADMLGTTSGDLFGCSTSMTADGLKLAIGAQFADNAFSNSGRGVTYERVAGVWTLNGSSMGGVQNQENSASSIGFSDAGNRAIVGAVGNSGGGTNAGTARIYDLVGTTWTLSPANFNGTAQSRTGTSVSISGDGSTVAIGAPTFGASQPGQVTVYKFDGNNWVIQGTAIGGPNASFFGGAVSLSSDGLTLAVGARSANKAFIYGFTNGVWTQIGATLDGESAGDQFGHSIALSRDASTVVVGARMNDGTGTDAGHARVFKNVNGVWTQVGADLDAEAAMDNFGRSVAINSTGDVVAVGADLANGAFNDAGHGRVYDLVGNNWVQRGADLDGANTNEYAGSSISLSGDGKLVALGYENFSNGRGRVRVYRFCGPTSGSFSVTSCSPYTVPSGAATYSTAGTYVVMDTILNNCNQDSVLTINLTIDTINLAVSNAGPTLNAAMAGATYQWLDCDNNFSQIQGETSQSFTASANGNYAVQISYLNCVDTSACVNVIAIGLDQSQASKVTVYPNPSTGTFKIATVNPLTGTYSVYNVLGEILASGNLEGNEIDLSAFEGGIYLLEIRAKEMPSQHIKLIKE